MPTEEHTGPHHLDPAEIVTDSTTPHTGAHTHDTDAASVSNDPNEKLTEYLGREFSKHPFSTEDYRRKGAQSSREHREPAITNEKLEELRALLEQKLEDAKHAIQEYRKREAGLQSAKEILDKPGARELMEGLQEVLMGPTSLEEFKEKYENPQPAGYSTNHIDRATHAFGNIPDQPQTKFPDSMMDTIADNRDDAGVGNNH